MGDTAVASKRQKLQLLVHKEKAEVGHKLLYSTLAKFPQVLKSRAAQTKLCIDTINCKASEKHQELNTRK